MELLKRTLQRLDGPQAPCYFKRPDGSWQEGFFEVQCPTGQGVEYRLHLTSNSETLVEFRFTAPDNLEVTEVDLSPGEYPEVIPSFFRRDVHLLTLRHKEVCVELLFYLDNQRRVPEFIREFEELCEEYRRLEAECKSLLERLHKSGDCINLAARYIEVDGNALFGCQFEHYMEILPSLAVGNGTRSKYSTGRGRGKRTTEEVPIHYGLIHKLLCERIGVLSELPVAWVACWHFLTETAVTHFFNRLNRERPTFLREIASLTVQQATFSYLANHSAQIDATGLFMVACALAGSKHESPETLYELYRRVIGYAKDYEANARMRTYETQLLRAQVAKALTIHDVDLLTGTQFERLVARLFAKAGYSTQATKQTGDQGIDVIAERNGIQYGIQAKRYSGQVGNAAIQEVVAGLAHYGLDRAVVVTNAKFTQAAMDLALANDVILWDRCMLEQKLYDLPVTMEELRG